jgi:hypothetical protein
MLLSDVQALKRVEMPRRPRRSVSFSSGRSQSRSPVKSIAMTMDGGRRVAIIRSLSDEE